MDSIPSTLVVVLAETLLIQLALISKVICRTTWKNSGEFEFVEQVVVFDKDSLILPFSNSSNERVFSLVKLRSRLSGLSATFSGELHPQRF